MHLVYGLYPNLGGYGFIRQALLGIGTALMVLIGATIAGASFDQVGLLPV